MALGHVPLEEMLRQLVNERSRQHPQLAFSIAASDLLCSYGDTVDLTVYRCIQESLTNAIRHADAARITVAARPADGASLELTVDDDGRGVSPAMAEGFGMRGIRERVEGLGGRYVVENGAAGGTRVRIVIPLAAAGGAEAAQAELRSEPS